MPDDVNLEDVEFERLLREKEHKSLLSALKRITDKLDVDGKGDDEVKAAFGEVAKSIKELPVELSKLLIPNKQEPINLDQEKVVAAIAEMGNKISKELCDLKGCIEKEEPPKEWVFTIERHYGNDLIKSVTAKQK